jgi:23S rRNA pseudouridine1911/1915/1917 synthase
MVVAKTLEAHASLVAQLQDKSLYREYEAVVQGLMTGGGKVDAPIGRHPTDRKRYSVRQTGKDAVTHYRVVERFARHTLIRVKLETGRTHQIRVHMAYVHFPLVGDPVYGGRFQLPPDCSEQLEIELRAFKRQALHAEKLGLLHPETQEYCEWIQPLPDDMIRLLAALRDNEQP